MANQNAVVDDSVGIGLLAHSGTIDDAETRKLTSQNIPGALDVYVAGGEESSPTGFNGGTVAIGTAPVELTFTGTTKSLMVTADFANGTVVYVGGSTVAQDGANAFTYLQPDQSVTFDLDDSSAPLYAVGGTTAQKIYKVALT